MKKTAFICIMAMLCSGVFSQDIRFSDFYRAPLILNPGNTGNFAANWRFNHNYRRQAINTDDPYVTANVSFEHPFYFLNERIGAGIVYINDVSGYGMLRVNKVYASLAYFKKISEQSYLHAGFQFGYVHKHFTTDGLSFPDQFDKNNGYYNTDLPSAERYRNASLSYADMNWGLLWTRRSEKFQTEFGIAMFHYNRPEETFYTEGQKLPIRWAVHFYPDIKLTDIYYVAPKVLYVYQNPASELIFGSDVAFRPKESGLKRVYGGVYFRGGFNRSPDICIFKIGFEIGNWEIGMGYDKEIADIQTGIYAKEAIELSFTYKAPLTHLKEHIVPCEVF